jgi:BlaI family penicillinase repressor
VKLSDSEWTVMNVVWDRPPVTVRDVHEVVQRETGWAYTTVKTTLERLASKGILRSRKRGNVGLYEPLVSRSQARKSAVRSLVEKAFDGTFGSLLQHILSDEKLSARDQKRLAELLDEARRSKGPHS